MSPGLKKWLTGGGIAEAIAHRIDDGGKPHYPFGLSPMTLILGGAIGALLLRR
jgi:hypothetical protein